MNDQTQINPNLHGDAVGLKVYHTTVINPNLTTVNFKLATGTVLADVYKVIAPMEISTGEADLYLCMHANKDYVAKVYRRKSAIKPEVIAKLQAIDSPYVASMYHAGTYQGFPYEILPYYKNGSLQGEQCSLQTLKDIIIPCINNALKVLHQQGIIHKDIKPSNLMWTDDHKKVAIIDFGISSVSQNGNTVLVTKTGMTPEYSAPETFRHLFLEESDYYSFGIAVFELFCGYTPYQHMTTEQIAQFTAIQRIPFPQNMPQELQDFISAVTYFDITNRNNKDNPNRRWTYAEVERWCQGKKQVIPGEGVGIFRKNEIPPYAFLGKEYRDVPSLVTVLAMHWSEGKKQLYRGLLTSFFKNFNPEIAALCMDAENAANKATGKDDIIFWSVLEKIQPHSSTFYWLGKTYESVAALGRDMLEKLWNKNEKDYAYWDGILDNKLLSLYLNMVQKTNESLETAVTALEESHALTTKSKRDCVLNYYLMAYMLSGQKILNIDGKQMKNVAELASYMMTLLDCSYEMFEGFCHRMIDYNDTLDVQIEAWLIALGKRKELSIWRTSLSE